MTDLPTPESVPTKQAVEGTIADADRYPNRTVTPGSPVADEPSEDSVMGGGPSGPQGGP